MSKRMAKLCDEIFTDLYFDSRMLVRFFCLYLLFSNSRRPISEPFPSPQIVVLSLFLPMLQKV